MRSYDVVVVGAGIIGGAIALRLAQEHLRVALFDSKSPAARHPGPPPHAFPRP